MKTPLLASLVGSLLCTAAFGQTTSYLSLWDGDFRYQIMRIVPTGSATRTNVGMGSDTQNINVNGNTEAWPTGYAPQADPDNRTWIGDTDGMRWSLTQQWWWYRGSGDTREYSVSNQTSFVQNPPSQVTMTYSEPVAGTANAILFTFVYTLTGGVAGPDTALVVIDFTIQNTSPSTQNAVLFSYIDYNAGGFNSLSDDVWSYQSNAEYSQHRVNASAAASFPFLTFGALGEPNVQNDRWGSSGSTPSFSRASFLNTTTQDLPKLNSESSPMSTTGSAWTGAIQWTRSLEPGATFSGRVYAGYNTGAPLPPACPADLGQQGGLPGADRVLDNNDFVAFIDAFFAHGAAADLGSQGGISGSDGSWDNNDFVVFIDQFFAGC